MIRPILAFLITVILCGFLGFATREFFRTGDAPIEIADALGIGAMALAMLVMLVWVGRQAKED